jgi:CubicO group peptidase (beta-lactamase class C family)
VQVVFSVNNDIVIDEAYGIAKVKSQAPMNNSNYHRIASVSKAITKQAIEELVRRGKISYINLVFKDIFTEFKVDAKMAKVTVKHLCDHTVGAWATNTRAVDPMFNYLSLKGAQFIQTVLDDTELEVEPGHSWCYSNFGYFLLGRVIEKVTGMLYIDYIK